MQFFPNREIIIEVITFDPMSRSRYTERRIEATVRSAKIFNSIRMVNGAGVPTSSRLSSRLRVPQINMKISPKR